MKSNSRWWVAATLNTLSVAAWAAVVGPPSSANLLLVSTKVSVAIVGIIPVHLLGPDDETAISRELTIGVAPPDFADDDGISRELTIGIAQQEVALNNSWSRELTIGTQESVPTIDNGWSRELTIGYDPDKPYFAESRELSIGGQRTFTAHLNWGEIDPSIIPSQLTLEIRDPANTLATTSQVVTLVNNSFSLVLPTRIVQLSFKTGKFLRMSPLGDCRAGDVSVEWTPINGDIDTDNAITILDYSILSDYFDKTSEESDWNVVGANEWRPRDADLDGDSAVTILDYSILSDNFDRSGDD